MTGTLAKEWAYGGPAPPDKRHTYVFKLYALDIGLDRYAHTIWTRTKADSLEKV